MKNGTKEVDKWIVRINAAGPPSNLSAQVNYEKIDNGTGTADDAEFEKLPKIGHKARDAEVCHGPPFLPEVRNYLIVVPKPRELKN